MHLQIYIIIITQAQDCTNSDIKGSSFDMFWRLNELIYFVGGGGGGGGGRRGGGGGGGVYYFSHDLSVAFLLLAIFIKTL